MSAAPFLMEPNMTLFYLDFEAEISSVFALSVVALLVAGWIASRVIKEWRK